MENRDIAQIFSQIADILEITGGNPYKIRAYRRAALNIEDLSKRVEDICRENKKALREIPGVGEAIAKKIEEIIKTGKLKKHQQLLKKVPPELLELMQITGIGPKHLKILKEKLGVKNAADLEIVCKQHRVQELEGFGEKSEKKILEAVGDFKHSKGRMKLDQAKDYAASVIQYLKQQNKNIETIEAAGSLRRGLETIGDLDILVASKDYKKVMDSFISYPEVKTVLSKGSTKSSIRLRSGFQVDLRDIKKQKWGSGLVYFTGSKAHNIHIRKIAKSMGLKINEYGIFRNKKLIASKTEKDIYQTIGLKVMPPELREDRGEIEAAQDDKLPKIIELKDIKGDLHMHTQASDGAHSIAEMVDAARKKDYEYVAITEHSKGLKIAGGLDEKELARHIKRIDKEDKKVKDIRILKGIEVDIKDNGKLDLDDSILKELDIVIAAIHTKFNMNKTEMTERILRAMNNKYVNILAHPTGRLIGKRKPYELDFERIFKKAKERNIFMELNSFPNRLDLKDIHCKMAKDMGVKIIISTDAHSRQQLDNMQFGVITARRGWLEKKDVLNTLKYEQFIERIKRS